jgi:hypothetical protein
MIGEEPTDALLDELRQLSTPSLRTSRDARTRSRCHDAMTHPRRGRTRLVDAVIGGAVALYAVAIASEGLRLLLR